MTETTGNKIGSKVSSQSLQQCSCSVKELQDMILKFTTWLEKNGYASYDPYDIWGTRYGKWARRLYYAKHPLGVVLTAPVILMEIVSPQWRALFVKKKRFATADAQLVLAFLNLYQITRGSGGLTTLNIQTSTSWLDKSKELAEYLLVCSIPGYSGHCWGYPFDWQNVNGLMPKGTPHITATPYCYEAFVRLFEVTGQAQYLEVARSAAAFVFGDLNDTPTGKDSAAGSYTPFDSGKVINANAYRAFVLFDAAQRFNYAHYRQKAWKNLKFILQSQQADGSWLYAIDNPAEAFIDHFHTCFVLKNLYKLNRHVRSEAVSQAIQNGYQYYRKALYDEDDNPRSFAIAPRRQIVMLEMYNYAEAINLGVLLKNNIPGAFALSCKLAHQLIKKYTLPDGHFVTRTYFAGFKHRLPFLRWPQAQLFYAITNLLVSLIQRDETIVLEEPLTTA
jgi:hypothetical protein